MNDPKIQYVLSHFTRILKLNNPLEVDYSEDESSGSAVWIRKGAGDFFNGRQVYEPGQVVWKRWRDQELPVLFAHDNEKPWFEVENGQVKIHYDVLASAFYFLSGWDEAYRSQRDSYGRFPYSAALIARLNIIGLPVVSWYADIIKEAIEESDYPEKLVQQPTASKFNIALTHDIDSLYSGWLQDGWAFIKQGRPEKVIKILWDKARGYDSWFNLGEMAEWENNLHVGASCYFLPRRDSRPGQVPQADYRIDDADLQNAVRNKLAANFECGVHGSIGSSGSEAQLREDMQRVRALTGRSPEGGRFHFLSFDPFATPEILESSGLRYDSTLGFAEHIGFRRSSAHPFYLYDLKNDRATTVLELPLIIMDTTFRQSHYQNVSPDHCLEVAQPILEQLKMVEGTAAILWHNTYLTEGKYAGWKSALGELINWIGQNNGRCVSAQDVLR